MIRRMSNTEKQESVADNNNTTEARLSFADRAEKLLRTILVALGCENVGSLRGEDLITSITAWVTLLITMKREPGGSYASFWARAFLDAWRDMSSVEAAESATAAVNEFAKRYPPMLDDVLIDEQERATQSDIQALTAELDKQVQLVWQLESELSVARLENNRLRDDMRAFDGGHDWRAHVKFIRESAELANLRSRFPGLCDDIDRLCLQNEQLQTRFTQCAEERDQLIRDTYGALVPLAKPERVEPGQRWAKLYRIDTNAHHEVFANGIVQPEIARDAAMLHGDTWLYLGTEV